MSALRLINAQLKKNTHIIDLLAYTHKFIIVLHFFLIYFYILILFIKKCIQILFNCILITAWSIY